MISLFIRPFDGNLLMIPRPQRSFIGEMLIMFRVSLGRIKILMMNLDPEKCKELRISFACNSKSFMQLSLREKSYKL